jgi:hypothetical protein
MGHRSVSSHLPCRYALLLSTAVLRSSLTGAHTLTRSSPDNRWPVRDPGTVVLIHYDLWHAGLENFSTDPSKPRFMFKFQFVRMQVPTLCADAGAGTRKHSYSPPFWCTSGAQGAFVERGAGWTFPLVA